MIPSRQYANQKNALAAIIRKRPSPALLTQLLTDNQASVSLSFVEFIIEQGLAGFWYSGLQQEGLSAAIPASLLLRFKEQWKKAAMMYLAQQGALATLDALFTQHKVAYAVIKGAHSREILYQNPSIRPSMDVDVLVAPEQKILAIRLLTGADFTLVLDTRTVSHEVSLRWNQAVIDLHWDVLRPGRTDGNLVQNFLVRKERGKNFWTLHQDDEVFLLLTHGVFAKYLTTPHARLAALADLYFWMEEQPLNWQRICATCLKSRLTTAAWLTACYLRDLTGTSKGDEFIDLFSPSLLKRHYLRFWVRHNFSTRFLRYPLLTQLFFTLPAHDSAIDAIRFLRHLAASKKNAGQEQKEIEAATCP